MLREGNNVTALGAGTTGPMA